MVWTGPYPPIAPGLLHCGSTGLSQTWLRACRSPSEPRKEPSLMRRPHGPGLVIPRRDGAIAPFTKRMSLEREQLDWFQSPTRHDWSWGCADFSINSCHSTFLATPICRNCVAIGDRLSTQSTGRLEKKEKGAYKKLDSRVMEPGPALEVPTT